MIDIHTHILPGIDDGAQEVEDMITMAQIAAESGTRVLVCTPHANQRGRFENYFSNQLEDLFRQAQELLKKEQIPLQLVLGMELFATMDMAEPIDQGKLIPLGTSKNYLVEFGFEEEPDYMQEILYGMMRQGAQPVLAHPERYACIQEYPAFIFDWMREGIYTQINKGSFFGRFGKREQRCAHELLEHNLITCVASDAHGANMRTPVLSDIFEYFEHNFSEEMALALTQWNPDRLLSGERIDQRSILPFSKKGWY